MKLNTQQKGTVAHYMVAAELTLRGFVPAVPLVEGTRYDLIVEKDGIFYKVQVKWCEEINGTIEVSLRKSHKNHILKYNTREIDAVVVFVPSLRKIYWIPSEIVCDRTSISLRTQPSKNNQIKSTRLATKFEI